MMYLSKGMEVPDGAEGVFRVCRWGKIHALGPQTAALWKRGAIAPDLLMGKCAQSRGWRNVEVWPPSAC